MRRAFLQAPIHGATSAGRLLRIVATAAVLSLAVTPTLAADAERGQKLFRLCKSCHQVGEKARNTVGPHLNEIFGRRAGTVDGVVYSADLTRAGVNGLHWDFENLDIYVKNPRSLVSGTRMQFGGVKKAKDREDILAYLRLFSDNPRDIPEAARTAMAATRDPQVDSTILAIQGDPEFGEYLAGECTTCHQATGEDKGIPSIVGWPTDVFVTAMHAYRGKARGHPVMQMIAAPLNDQEIAALAAYFETLQE